jgi:hypothetical protein
MLEVRALLKGFAIKSLIDVVNQIPDDVSQLVDHLCQQLVEGCAVEAPPGSFALDTVIFELYLGLQDFFR